MLKQEDKLLLEMNKEISADIYSTLQLFYYPLMGVNACLFYTTILSFISKKIPVTNHVLLAKTCGMSMEAMKKARSVCEEFLLMRTFYHKENATYLYVMDVPLTPNRFLAHEVFGRLFLNKMGEEVVTTYKKQIAIKKGSRAGYQELSSTMNDLLKNNWDSSQEKAFQDVKEEMSQMNYDYLHIIFDEKIFLSGLSELIFPKKERTKKNMRQIAEIATIYGINETMMKSLISKGIRLPENKFDVKKLKDACFKTKAKYVSDNKDPYKLPPRRYLEYKQNGVSLNKADLLLIEKMICEYRLQPEVINILIETCLLKYDQKIVGTTLERMAASWMRLNVDTLEKAKAQQQKELNVSLKKNSGTTIVQHWDYEEEEMSEEKRASLIEKIRGSES